MDGEIYETVTEFDYHSLLEAMAGLGFTIQTNCLNAKLTLPRYS
jgi:hypothetical protein